MEGELFMEPGSLERSRAAIRPVLTPAPMIRRIMSLAGLAILLAVPGWAGSKLTAQELIHNLKYKTYTGDRIELRFTDAGLAEILAKFEEISGLKFEVSPSVDLKKEPPKRYNFLGYSWDRALDSILSDNGLGLKLEGDALWVELFTPDRDKTVSAFFVGSVTAAVIFGGAVLVLARRKRRRRNMERERKITLDPSAIEEAVQRLKFLFQIEKIHRNERLSLDSLSERLALQPYQLSGIINSRLGKTFTDFVADYRVEEVKRRLSDPGETANILNIAYDAGFGTKASFNRIFKERTGLTPSEFRSRGPAAK